jgi:hypothetical protein
MAILEWCSDNQLSCLIVTATGGKKALGALGSRDSLRSSSVTPLRSVLSCGACVVGVRRPRLALSFHQGSAVGDAKLELKVVSKHSSLQSAKS